MPRVRFRQFASGLWVSGPRDAIPPDGLRRLKGVHGIRETSLRSRHGSTKLVEVPGETVTSISQLEDVTWFGTDAGNLYSIEDGVATLRQAGFNEGPLYLLPGQSGTENVLFISGGGENVGLIKAGTDGQVTSWGIDPPPNGFTVKKIPALTKTIEDFEDPNIGIIASRWNNQEPISDLHFRVLNDALQGTNYMTFDVTFDTIATAWRRGAHDLTNFSTDNFGPHPSYDPAANNGRPAAMGDEDYITFWLRINHGTDIIGISGGNQIKSGSENIQFIQITFGLDDNDDPLRQTNVYTHALLTHADRLTTDSVFKVTRSESFRKAIRDSPITDSTGFRRTDGAFGIFLTSSATLVENIVLPNIGNTTIIDSTPGIWQRVKIRRGAFDRRGIKRPTFLDLIEPEVDETLDWRDVKRMLITIFAAPGAVSVDFDFFRAEGGFGTQGSYAHAITYKNSTTGVRSNPSDGVRTDDVDREAFLLQDLPVPVDSQVDEIEIWRTIGETAPQESLATLTDGHDRPMFLAATVRVEDLATGMLLGEEQTRSGITGVQEYTEGASDAFQLIPTDPSRSTGNIITDGKSKTATFSVPQESLLEGAQILVELDNDVIQSRHVASREFTGGFSVTLVQLDEAVDWDNGGVGYPFTFKNPVPILEDEVLPLDNITPFDTFIDIAGPYLGRWWWTNRKAGDRGRLYYSPVDRPESLFDFRNVTTDGDPLQRVLIWNGQLWVISTEHFYQIVGTTGVFGVREVFGAPGTTKPLSVQATSIGIIYQAADGIRLFDGVSSLLIGYEALKDVFHREVAAGIVSFSGDISAAKPDEYWISDENTTLALQLRSATWRELGLALDAAYYNADDGEVLAGIGEKLLAVEREETITDDGDAIEFEVETAGLLVDASQEGFIQRLYIDVVTGDQLLTPTLILDDEEIELAPLLAGERKTIEYALNKTGRVIGVRLEGNLTDEVEVFGIEADVHIFHQVDTVQAG